MDQLVSFILGIVGGTLSSIVASLLSRRKNEAERNKLEEETKKLKEETRKLAIEISSLKDAPKKEVLVSLHEKMLEAIGGITALTSSWKVQPSLKGYSDQEILEFLKSSPYSDFEKQQLIKSSDRDVFYGKLIEFHEFHEAKKSLVEFHNHFIKNMIWITNEKIVALFTDLDKLLREVISATESRITHMGDFSFAEIYIKSGQRIPPLKDEIEALIKSELNTDNSSSQ
jgi:hypothetical protein